MKPVYKRMLQGMQEKAKTSPQAQEAWYLYILRCADDTFYTGVTKNLERRLQQHQKGKASRYTRTRLPVEMIYRETCEGHAAALVRECAVKALPRKSKEKLIKS